MILRSREKVLRSARLQPRSRWVEPGSIGGSNGGVRWAVPHPLDREGMNNEQIGCLNMNVKDLRYSCTTVSRFYIT